MNLKVMFTVAAVYGFLVGLVSLFFPDFGSTEELTDVTLNSLRVLGVAHLGLGIIAWLVRNADASKARDAVTLGFTIFFPLHALTSLYGGLTDSRSEHWFAATLQALIAVGFYVAGKAAMATTAN
jgi:uncharacterized protein YjeT (DUF2065 family)